MALYSIKGGVGKTAGAVNLAYCSALAGQRTLVWDLDPQGASSFYFRIKAKVKGGGKKLIAGKSEVADLIKGTDFERLDLLPADFSYRNLDLSLNSRKHPVKQLNKLLDSLADDYDLVFLDCPPSISLLSEAVFKAADVILSPIIPTTLSLRTLEQLRSFIGESGFKLDLLPYFSMADRRKKMHKNIIDFSLKNDVSFLRSIVPYASDIEMMGIHRLPLQAFAKQSPSGKAYCLLWQEIYQHLNR